MKSRYYSLARFRPADGLQIGKKFFVGFSLYFMRKLLAFACFHKTTMNIGAAKYLKLSIDASGGSGLYDDGGGGSNTGGAAGAIGNGAAGIAVVITYF